MLFRSKNFIKPEQFPYVSAAGLEYDTGNYDALVDKLNELADFKGFEARRKLSEADGKLRGLGINAYIEACGLAPSNLTGVLGSRVGSHECRPHGRDLELVRTFGSNRWMQRDLSRCAWREPKRETLDSRMFCSRVLSIQAWPFGRRL